MSDPLTPEEIDAFAKALGIEPDQVGEAAAEPTTVTSEGPTRTTQNMLGGTKWDGTINIDDIVDQVYWMADETIREFFGDEMFGVAQSIGSDIAPAIAQIMTAIQSEEGLAMVDLDRCIRRLAVVVTASTVTAIRENYSFETELLDEDDEDEDGDDWG